jgi:hypothetical protein
MSATEVHSPGRDAAAGTADMTGNSQYTAPTLTIDAANGTTYAYRRFGRNGAVPVVFRQHFRGNLDNWGSGPGLRHRGRARSHPRRQQRSRPVDRLCGSYLFADHPRMPG